jgi:hypothetical protein
MLKMNTLVRQRYVGPDADGHLISGLILHAGRYNKHGIAVNYTVQCDDRSLAIVPSDVIARHLEGLEFVAWLEPGNPRPRRRHRSVPRTLVHPLMLAANE